MERVLTHRGFQKAISTLMALFLFIFFSFPVLIHIHHDAITGEHVTDFHQDLANHFHPDTHVDDHVVDNLTDDTHVIDGESSFILKKLSDSDSRILVAILCLLLILPLLQQALSSVTSASKRFIPIRSHNINPPLRAPPIYS